MDGRCRWDANESSSKSISMRSAKDSLSPGFFWSDSLGMVFEQVVAVLPGTVIIHWGASTLISLILRPPLCLQKQPQNRPNQPLFGRINSAIMSLKSPAIPATGTPARTKPMKMPDYCFKTPFPWPYPLPLGIVPRCIVLTIPRNPKKRSLPPAPPGLPFSTPSRMPLILQRIVGSSPSTPKNIAL